MNVDINNYSLDGLISLFSGKPQITAVSLARSLHVKQKTINALLDGIGFGSETEGYPYLSDWQVDQVIKRLAKSFKKQYTRSKKRYFALTQEEKEEFHEIQDIFRSCKNRVHLTSLVEFDISAVSEYLSKLTDEAHVLDGFRTYDTSILEGFRNLDFNHSDYTALNTDYLFLGDDVSVEQIEEYFHRLIYQTAAWGLLDFTGIDESELLNTAIFNYLGNINIKGCNYVCSHTAPAIMFYIGNHYYIFNDDDDDHSQRNSARKLLT